VLTPVQIFRVSEAKSGTDDEVFDLGTLLFGDIVVVQHLTRQKDRA
jgi:hypothetical protein